MSPITRTFAAVAALASIAAAGVAAAQDWRLPPTYGTVTLSAGFLPDPHVTNLQSGGSIDAARLGGECRGFVANAPDVDLRYTSGNYNLTISVVSDADTTLVINGPDGRWYCNDDANGLNPSITFTGPRSGLYDIYVGTYGNSSLQPAQLLITER
jgi:hypothetical protein